MNGCARQNQIDFSSSQAFFSSLNETETIQKKNKKSTPVINSLKKSKINNKDEGIIKKSLLLNLVSYKKILEKKIGFEEYNILKIFNMDDQEYSLIKKNSLEYSRKYLSRDLLNSQILKVFSNYV